MNDRVWIIADAPSGEASYVRHGHEGQEDTWKVIGPFVYTKREDAEAAIADRRFLPNGVEGGSFVVIGVETPCFVQAIYNGFPPSGTDVFALDEGLFPLTEGGAQWIDEALDAPVWAPHFDENGEQNGLAWLRLVLDQVAQRIGMSQDAVEAIGMLNATDEDDEDEVARARRTIMENVQVAIVPEPETVALRHVGTSHELTTEARFWLHTIGLGRFKRPELEIRNVPAWWVAAAGAELNGWAAYCLDHEIKAGEQLQAGGPVPVQLRAVQSPDPFWRERDTLCLRLEVAQVFFRCGHQNHGGPTVH